MNFHSMKRKALQALCKKHNLPANTTNLEMANSLNSLLMASGKPKTRGPSCLKGSGEIAAGDSGDGLKDSDVVTRVSKKVRFLLQDEMPLLIDSNGKYSAEKKKAARRGSRSLAGKSLDTGRSSPVEKKKGRKGVKSKNDGKVSSVVVVSDDYEENDTKIDEEVGLVENIVAATRSLRDRKVLVVEKNLKLDTNGGKEDAVPRKTRRAANENQKKDGAVGVVDVEFPKNTTKNRSRKRKNDNANEVSDIDYGEVVIQSGDSIQEESKMSSKSEIGPRRSKRTASKIEVSDEMLKKNDSRKRSRNLVAEEDAIVPEIREESERVSKFHEPVLRRSSRNTTKCEAGISSDAKTEEVSLSEIVTRDESVEEIIEAPKESRQPFSRNTRRGKGGKVTDKTISVCEEVSEVNPTLATSEDGELSVAEILRPRRSRRNTSKGEADVSTDEKVGHVSSTDIGRGDKYLEAIVEGPEKPKSFILRNTQRGKGRKVTGEGVSEKVVSISAEVSEVDPKLVPKNVTEERKGPGRKPYKKKQTVRASKETVEKGRRSEEPNRIGEEALTVISDKNENEELAEDDVEKSVVPKNVKFCGSNEESAPARDVETIELTENFNVDLEIAHAEEVPVLIENSSTFTEISGGEELQDVLEENSEGMLVKINESAEPTETHHVNTGAVDAEVTVTGSVSGTEQFALTKDADMTSQIDCYEPAKPAEIRDVGEMVTNLVTSKSGVDVNSPLQKSDDQEPALEVDGEEVLEADGFSQTASHELDHKELHKDIENGDLDGLCVVVSEKIDKKVPGENLISHAISEESVIKVSEGEDMNQTREIVPNDCVSGVLGCNSEVVLEEFAPARNAETVSQIDCSEPSQPAADGLASVLESYDLEPAPNLLEMVEDCQTIEEESFSSQSIKLRDVRNCQEVEEQKEVSEAVDGFALTVTHEQKEVSEQNVGKSALEYTTETAEEQGGLNELRGVEETVTGKNGIFQTISEETGMKVSDEDDMDETRYVVSKDLKDIYVNFEEEPDQNCEVEMTANIDEIAEQGAIEIVEEEEVGSENEEVAVDEKENEDQVDRRYHELEICDGEEIAEQGTIEIVKEEVDSKNGEAAVDEKENEEDQVDQPDSKFEISVKFTPTKTEESSEFGGIDIVGCQGVEKSLYEHTLSAGKQEKGAGYLGTDQERLQLTLVPYNTESEEKDWSLESCAGMEASRFKAENFSGANKNEPATEEVQEDIDASRTSEAFQEELEYKDHKEIWEAELAMGEIEFQDHIEYEKPDQNCEKEQGTTDILEEEVGSEKWEAGADEKKNKEVGSENGEAGADEKENKEVGSENGEAAGGEKENEDQVGQRDCTFEISDSEEIPEQGATCIVEEDLGSENWDAAADEKKNKEDQVDQQDCKFEIYAKFTPLKLEESSEFGGIDEVGCQGEYLTGAGEDAENVISETGIVTGLGEGDWSLEGCAGKEASGSKAQKIAGANIIELTGEDAENVISETGIVTGLGEGDWSLEGCAGKEASGSKAQKIAGANIIELTGEDVQEVVDATRTSEAFLKELEYKACEGGLEAELATNEIEFKEHKKSCLVGVGCVGCEDDTEDRKDVEAIEEMVAELSEENESFADCTGKECSSKKAREVAGTIETEACMEESEEVYGAARTTQPVMKELEGEVYESGIFQGILEESAMKVSEGDMNKTREFLKHNCDVGTEEFASSRAAETVSQIDYNEHSEPAKSLEVGEMVLNLISSRNSIDGLPSMHECNDHEPDLNLFEMVEDFRTVEEESFSSQDINLRFNMTCPEVEKQEEVSEADGFAQTADEFDHKEISEKDVSKYSSKYTIESSEESGEVAVQGTIKILEEEVGSDNGEAAVDENENRKGQVDQQDCGFESFVKLNLPEPEEFSEFQGPDGMGYQDCAPRDEEQSLYEHTLSAGKLEKDCAPRDEEQSLYEHTLSAGKLEKDCAPRDEEQSLYEHTLSSGKLEKGLSQGDGEVTVVADITEFDEKNFFFDLGVGDDAEKAISETGIISGMEEDDCWSFEDHVGMVVSSFKAQEIAGENKIEPAKVEFQEAAPKDNEHKDCEESKEVIGENKNILEEFGPECTLVVEEENVETMEEKSNCRVYEEAEQVRENADTLVGTFDIKGGEEASPRIKSEKYSQVGGIDEVGVGQSASKDVRMHEISNLFDDMKISTAKARVKAMTRVPSSTPLKSVERSKGRPEAGNMKENTPLLKQARSGTRTVEKSAVSGSRRRALENLHSPRWRV